MCYDFARAESLLSRPLEENERYLRKFQFMGLGLFSVRQDSMA